jgi:hypothetical protein
MKPRSKSVWIALAACGAKQPLAIDRPAADFFDARGGVVLQF